MKVLAQHGDLVLVSVRVKPWSRKKNALVINLASGVARTVTKRTNRG